VIGLPAARASVGPEGKTAGAPSRADSRLFLDEETPEARRGGEPPGADTLLPFLARDDSLAWLEARRREAGAMLASAHLVGEEGIGKTRLLSEFLRRCAARGDRVVEVGPDPARARIGDAAVRSAAHGLLSIAGQAIDTGLWKVAHPDARRGLAILFGPTPPDEWTPDERRRALREALTWSLHRATLHADGAMVVLAIDDLDCIDGTSQNAFADLLAELPLVTSALVVFTYAPTSRPAIEPSEGEFLQLAPLPHASFARMLPPHLASDGKPLSPLHVEQLIAWAEQGGDPPPERLAELAARRTERLPPDARHVLHALSVWAEPANPRMLELLLPPGLDVTAALDTLCHAHFVAGDAGSVRIRHPLLQRVAFSGIPAGQKAELFLRAERLRTDPPLEIRARYAVHGGSALEALSLLDALSTRRAIYGDVLGAVDALRRALDVARRELHRGELDDPIGAMLVFSRKLAEVLTLAEQWTDAEGVLREALGNAPPNSEHRVRLLGMLAGVANARRQTQEARRYLEEAKRVARQSDARELMPMLENIERLIAVA
jgi:serine/threonine-protein kinase